MKYKVIITITSALLIGCGSEDTDLLIIEGDGFLPPSCSNTIELPTALIGLWSRTFERNGATGTAYLTITDGCTLNSSEVGNYQIMEEWFSGLDEGMNYTFYSNPAQDITEITESELYIESTSSGGFIVNENNEVIQTWDMSSPGMYMQYSLSDSETELTISYSTYNGSEMSSVYELVQ